MNYRIMGGKFKFSYGGGVEMVSKVMFSSKIEEYGTPQKLFDQLNLEFGPFTLDPCATMENAKCKTFFTRKENGLIQSWGKSKVFMNPPYGKNIRAWIQKAYDSSKSGATVICLVPARVSTAWWHDLVEGKAQYRFIRGKLKFEGAPWVSPFPSAILIYRPCP